MDEKYNNTLDTDFWYMKPYLILRSYRIVWSWNFLTELLDLENGSGTIFRNVGNGLPNNRTSHLRRFDLPLWKVYFLQKKLANCRTVYSYFVFSKTHISKSYYSCDPNCTSAYTTPHFHSWIHLNILTFIEPSELCCYSKLGQDHCLDYTRSGRNFSLRRNTLVVFSTIISEIIFILSPKMHTSPSEHWTAPPSNRVKTAWQK
jgi:hypothetical protein